ncbi:MAG: hypothetical protein WBZ42_08440 [Halobacteriota archaeon]
MPDVPSPKSQLQAYIDANTIGEEEPLFPITQQWVRAIINKYAN